MAVGYRGMAVGLRILTPLRRPSLVIPRLLAGLLFEVSALDTIAFLALQRCSGRSRRRPTLMKTTKLLFPTKWPMPWRARQVAAA